MIHFENSATERALRAWCEENDTTLVQVWPPHRSMIDVSQLVRRLFRHT